MKSYKFKKIFNTDKVLTDSIITVGTDGIIKSIEDSESSKNIANINGYALPGFQNTHSHAFQFAMAGLAESINNKEDDFWTWRESMYSLANSCTPEEIEKIATSLYCQLVKLGYTEIAEFHYLHNDQRGKKYINPAEMSERLMAAAAKAKIKLCLVPIFYQKNNFNQGFKPEQKRFISQSLDDYLKLFEAIKKVSSNYKNTKLGIGVHSLRAVELDSLRELFSIKELQKLPKHLHISEQLKEVNDCISHLQKRPVEWLAENVDLNNSYNLVHATHINDSEIKLISKSKANVVLCPSTEGNLGDGIFPLKQFTEQNGNFSIGTDSHIGLSFFEELRWLDYGQRLLAKNRNPLELKKGSEAGSFLFHQAIQNGRAGMGNVNQEFFKIGAPFDAAVIDVKSPNLENIDDLKILSKLIYTADSSVLLGTFVNGEWIPKN